MSSQNKYSTTQVFIGSIVIIVIFIGIYMMMYSSKSSTPTPTPLVSEQFTVENFPQSTPMNVMYSDASGNLGTTTDLGLQNLTVSGDVGMSQKLTAGSISTGDLSSAGSVNVNGKMNVHSGAPAAVPSGYMSNGSLTIGDVSKNFGGGIGWNPNTAGLMMECADNTEIAVHDSGARVASAMYYHGPSNTISIGRDMGAGWGASNVSVGGSLTVAGRNILAEFDALKAELDALKATLNVVKTDPLKCMKSSTYNDNNEAAVRNSWGHRSLGHLLEHGFAEGRSKSAIDQNCASSY